MFHKPAGIPFFQCELFSLTWNYSFAPTQMPVQLITVSVATSIDCFSSWKKVFLMNESELYTDYKQKFPENPWKNQSYIMISAWQD